MYFHMLSYGLPLTLPCFYRSFVPFSTYYHNKLVTRLPHHKFSMKQVHGYIIFHELPRVTIKFLEKKQTVILSQKIDGNAQSHIGELKTRYLFHSKCIETHLLMLLVKTGPSKKIITKIAKKLFLQICMQKKKSSFTSFVTKLKSISPI